MALGAQELEMNRKDAESVFSTSCAILRFTKTGNAGGSVTKTWTPVHSNVPCRIAAQSGGPAGEVAGKPDERSVQVATLPWDADLRLTDRIECEGRTYEVTQIPNRNMAERFVLRAWLMVVS